MGVSASCVRVCARVHCWWIKTTVADGVSEWEAGKEESRSSHLGLCFSSLLQKKASISLLLSQTDKNNHCSLSIHTANTNTHSRALLTWLNIRSATCVRMLTSFPEALFISTAFELNFLLWILDLLDF